MSHFNQGMTNFIAMSYTTRFLSVLHFYGISIDRFCVSELPSFVFLSGQ